MSRLFHILLLLVACASQASGQDFCVPWISFPEADDAMQVWFREEIELDEAPRYATLLVMTSGRMEVFVNERNVSTDVMMPCREAINDTTATGIRFDIARFLHPGTNIIAVAYSPSARHSTTRQIAVVLRGAYNNGCHFAVDSDEGWLCRPASTSLTDEGHEQSEPALMPMKWTSDDIDLARWVPSRLCPEPFGEEDEWFEGCYEAERVAHVRHADYFDIEPEGIYYVFNEPFIGWVRVTMRGAKRGQRVACDGQEYVCTGQTDEQTCGRFVASPHHRVLISVEGDMLPDIIANVEALEILPYFHQNF
ncbi:MAG: hypothetical protein IJ196_05660 [Prevotella sp.]|nr:hypothetical protein [Prevotella sp.]